MGARNQSIWKKGKQLAKAEKLPRASAAKANRPERFNQTNKPKGIVFGGCGGWWAKREGQTPSSHSTPFIKPMAAGEV